MRPCGANYENQCSSKWVAHGGGLRGTCEEEPGVEVPPKATAWRATRGADCVRLAYSYTSAQRPADKSRINANTLPGGGRGFSWSPPAPPQYLNDLSDVNRRQMRKSQRGGAAGGCTQHCKHTSIFRVRVCRYVLGFHSVARLLIDWYFHYGHRVVWRMLICLGVLQVYNDCSGARRKAKLMKLTEPNHNLWVKIDWLIII